jgi:hypothetical protein
MSKTFLRFRDVHEYGGQLPVYQIDESGGVSQFGILQPILDGYYYEPHTSESPQMYRSLPWFIQDMRPDGFMGRAFARNMHPELGLPERLEDWSDNHLLVALARRGEDCIGDLIVGEEALERYSQSVRENAPPIAARERDTSYPRMATAAMEGKPVGSLAGGEQPKFTAVVERNGSSVNVLVKFSPMMDTPGGRRWADLLICEHLALETIRSAGLPAAKSTLHIAGGRTFLEVERFDRVGRFGRIPINSIGVVDDEFFGYRDNWMNMADRLESSRMVSPHDADVLRWLSAFGEMIANTDMHLGNASLILEDLFKPAFSLAPAYDMLPMRYRPRDGEVTSPQFSPPVVASVSRWEGALQHALQFWEAAAHDERITSDFRKICAANRELLCGAASGPHIVS